MAHQLHYGSHSLLSLPDTPQVQVASCLCPGQPLGDLTAATANALAHPLNHPPLHLATTPGDRVALALDRTVPQAGSIVAGVVQTLLKAGVEPRDVTILLSDGQLASTGADRRSDAEISELTGQLPPAMRDEIQVHWHDGRSRKQLAYLAASRNASPVYLNRRLVDADVVLPIGTISLASSLGYLGVHGGLFPLFSDQQTMQRFQQPPLPGESLRQQQLKEQCDEAAWLLGVLLSVQILPGPADSVLKIVAGETGAVEQRTQQLACENWLHQAPFRAKLVVATISGGEPQQTWRNFSRALFAASHAAAENSDIVICTQLHSKPAPPPTHPHHEDTDETIEENVAAITLAAAQRNSRVFLLSDLPSDVVEDLGLAAISHAEEVCHLARRHNSWLLLPDAQHAMVHASDEMPAGSSHG